VTRIAASQTSALRALDLAPGTVALWWLGQAGFAVRAGGLVFTSGASGLVDATTGRVDAKACGDRAAQVARALDRLESVLERAGSDLANLLRLDVFLNDIYFADAFLALASERLGRSGPAISFIGGKPAQEAAVELSAIACDA